MTTDDHDFMHATPDDIRRLLAIAASIDGRTWADDTAFRAAAASWYETIRRELGRRRFRLTGGLAEAAVYAWYGRESFPVKPAGVLDMAQEIRRDRLAATPVPDPPEDLDVFDDKAVAEAMGDAREVIAAGGSREDALAAMAAVARRHPLRQIERTP